MEDETKDDSTAVVDKKVQSILDLLNQHVAGEATNQEVERAVANLLEEDVSTANQADSTKPPARASVRTSARLACAAEKIEQDTENYDDEDEDEAPQAGSSKRTKDDEAITGISGSQESNCRKRRTVRSSRSELKEPPLDSTLYRGIPLGYQGAKMMTTFGDGKQPDPAAVRSVLNGARKMLQVAIQDARYIRRQHRLVYASAQRSVGGDNKLPKEIKDVKFEFSTELLFQAHEGHDPLAKEHKCGFAIGDLHILFPEEINAYMRWSAMNAETEAAKQPNALAEEEQAAEEDITPDEQAIKDGHLQERAAQFDVRTQRMKDSWYLTYAELRQGSFLPRGTRASKGQVTGWGKLKLPAVRFLHWCGFDPNSPLPPPTEDTIDALAFLGYDFVGRIVEKAISIRKHSEKEADEIIELDINEQLTEEDVAKSMEKLNPVPLYSSEPNMNGVKAHPLYFGPGFEKRLEMEIEEFMLDKKLSAEEQDLRQQEDEFFASLAGQVEPKEFPDLDDEEKVPAESPPPPKRKKRRKSS